MCLLRQNVTQKLISNDLRLDLLPKVIKEGIVYKKTFSWGSNKDFFRIIMTLMAQYDFELYQMDLKMTFLIVSFDKEIYIEQPKNYWEMGKGQLVWRLKNSIYGLKQAPSTTIFTV